MRRGLFQPDQVADQTTDRNFTRVKEAIAKLTADDDVIGAPIATLVASAAFPAGASIVNFTGGATQTLSLPPANVLGSNVGAVIFFLNTSPNNVTLIPSRGDTVNATTSLTVATNVLAILVSDGVSKWLRNV